MYNAIVAGRLKTAMENAVQSKGFREVSSSPDIYVAWHGAINGKMRYETISNDYSYGWGRYGSGGWHLGATATRTEGREPEKRAEPRGGEP